MIRVASARGKAAVGLGIAILLAGALVVVLASETRANTAGRRAASLGDGDVVATLEPARASYPADLRSLLSQSRAVPDDRPTAKRAAGALISYGRTVGDSRLVGAALGILDPFLSSRDPEVLTLAAEARQYQHDFRGALGLLDQAIVLAPSDGGAILTRATIHVVVGDLKAAAADCRLLGGLRRVDLSIICRSTVDLLSPSAPATYRKLEAIVGRGDVFDAPLRAYATSLMGEIAMLLGWRDKARADLTAALDQMPEDARPRMMLADELLIENDPAAALTVLEPGPEIDGVVLRRAIAARRLGREEIAGPAVAELERRFALNRSLGLTSHAREEARYYLEVAGDPKLALERATVNWALQREFEDAQLLLNAAAAAGDAKAGEPASRWLRENDVAVPMTRVQASEAAR